MNEVLHTDWHASFFRDVLELSDAAILVINSEFEVVYANDYICSRILGMPQPMAVGMSLPRHTTVPDEDLQRVIDHTKRVFELGVAGNIENWALHKDGSRRLMYWSSVPKFDEHGKVQYLLATGIDVTEQRKEKNQLEKLAHRDVLTNLYNRAFFDRRLTEDMERAIQEESALALFYVDLDGFKPVNDRYGHERGDAILCEVACRLKRRLRQNDIVCRIGGDEFAVIFPGVSSREDAARIADQMIDHISRPYDSAENTHAISASIGIAFYDHSMKSAHDFVRKADSAMYQAKRGGKGKFVIAN